MPYWLPFHVLHFFFVIFYRFRCFPETDPKHPNPVNLTHRDDTQQWFTNHERGSLKRELASIYHYYLHPEHCPDGIRRWLSPLPLTSCDIRANDYWIRWRHRRSGIGFQFCNRVNSTMNLRASVANRCASNEDKRHGLHGRTHGSTTRISCSCVTHMWCLSLRVLYFVCVLVCPVMTLK